jgi:nicotinamidase-related amidase
VERDPDLIAVAVGEQVVVGGAGRRGARLVPRHGQAYVAPTADRVDQIGREGQLLAGPTSTDNQIGHLAGVGADDYLVDRSEAPVGRRDDRPRLDLDIARIHRAPLGRERFGGPIGALGRGCHRSAVQEMCPNGGMRVAERGAMPAQNQDLHGNVPDRAEVVLLLVDVINDLEFPGGELLVEHALPMADRIAALKRRAKGAGIPVIYVNDNFGRWQSDLNKLLAHCLEDDVRGRPMVERLKPAADDYFVLKPKTLILTGVAGDICILFTASDAFLRDYRTVVPADCVASNDPDDNRHALEQMHRVLKADVTPSTELDLSALAGPAEGDG